jgi:hypothetical protein
VSAARGEVIAFLEQDDIWLPEKLDRQIDRLNAGFWLADCRFFFYDPIHRRLQGLGGGNFSTLIGRRRAVEMLFPLPEDKKLLGIEDGILAGRLALLSADQSLPDSKVCHMAEPLVIVSRHRDSLSGQGETTPYIARYQAAADFFASEKSTALDKLKSFWQRQKRANRFLSLFPPPLQMGLRHIKFRLRRIGLAREWKIIKNGPEHRAACRIINKL